MSNYTVSPELMGLINVWHEELKGEKTMNIKEKREQFDGFVRNACMLYGAEYEIEYYPHACETTYKIGNYAPDVFVIRWGEVRDIRSAANEIMGALLRRNPSAGGAYISGARASYMGKHGISKPYVDPMGIKDVIFNDPATIVFWADGTKTVVKCQEGDVFDPEKGLAMAIAKKVYGNKHDYYDPFKKWCGRYYKKRAKIQPWIDAIDDAVEKLKDCDF